MYIESPVPYDKSIVWELHNQFFQTRGSQAWLSGSIPFQSINSIAMARQHARFLCTLYEQECKGGLLLEGDPFCVLEIGAGLGLFAANIFEALCEDCGKTGKILSKSLRYILSDYQVDTVQAAMDSAPIQKWKKQIIPAIFDMRTVRLSDFEQNQIDDKPYVIFANYVCCVAPGKQLRFDNGSWSELYAQVQATPEDWKQYTQEDNHNILKDIPIEFVWKEISLSGSLPLDEDVALIKRVRGNWNEASFYYPYVFFHMLQELDSIMMNRGYVIISDYGQAPCDGIAGKTKKSIEYYGNTLNHAVSFALFSEFAQLHGWSALLTSEPVRSIQHVCLRIGHSVSHHVADSFAHNYNQCFDGEDLSLFWEIAQKYMDEKQYRKSAYFASRCIQLNPHDPRYSYLAARALIAEGNDLAAQYYLQIGHALPVHPDCNFAFQMGRVAVHMGYLNDAIRYYEEAELHSQFPALYSNKAYILIDLFQYKQAYAALQKSFALNPDHAPSTECLSLLKEKIWLQWQDER